MYFTSLSIDLLVHLPASLPLDGWHPSSHENDLA